MNTTTKQGSLKNKLICRFGKPKSKIGCVSIFKIHMHMDSCFKKIAARLRCWAVTFLRSWLPSNKGRLVDVKKDQWIKEPYINQYNEMLYFVVLLG